MGFAVSRGAHQPKVAADALPLVAAAHRADVYVDCSKINSVTYDTHNPCETFVLLGSKHFGSATKFWAAETQAMKLAGWHHSAPQVVDYDGTDSGMASRRESWVSPRHRACAYVTTDARGVAAEKRALFPYDPNDNPHGVYVFYRRAKKAQRTEALWVRLRPPNADGRCIG